ncbi:MAG: tetratricopeptide repeat protein [Paracoccaceae bacterium]
MFCAVASLSVCAALAAGPGRAETEDEALTALREAPDAQVAERAASRVLGIWGRSGSAAVDLLVRRGDDALEAGDVEAALDHFLAATDHAPGHAPAWAGRAAALYATGRVGPALDALRETLVLEPAHFEALLGFSAVLRDIGRPEQALEVLDRLDAIHPFMPQAAELRDLLERETGGRTL